MTLLWLLNNRLCPEIELNFEVMNLAPNLTSRWPLCHLLSPVGLCGLGALPLYPFWFSWVLSASSWDLRISECDKILHWSPSTLLFYRGGNGIPIAIRWLTHDDQVVSNGARLVPTLEGWCGEKGTQRLWSQMAIFIWHNRPLEYCLQLVCAELEVTVPACSLSARELLVVQGPGGTWSSKVAATRTSVLTVLQCFTYHFFQYRKLG